MSPNTNSMTAIEGHYDLNNPSGWSEEPGYNSSQLEPAHLFVDSSMRVVKTLPPHAISVSNQEISGLSHATTFCNDVYHEVSPDLTEAKWVNASIFPLAFLMLIASIFFMLFIIQEKFLSTREIDVGSFVLMLAAIFMIFATLVMSIAFYQGAFKVPYGISMRFCRRNKKVYVYTGKKSNKWYRRGIIIGKARIDEIDWENCRAEIHRGYMANAIGSGGRFCWLMLVVLDKHTKQVIDRIQIGGGILSAHLHDSISSWESLRRYMQDELTTIPFVNRAITRRPRGLLDGLNRLNPLRLLLSSHVALITPFNGKTLDTTPKLWIKIFKFFDLPIYVMFWMGTPVLIYAACMRYLSFRFSPTVDWSELDKTVFKPEIGSRAAAQMADMQLESEKIEKENQVRNKTKRQWLWLWLGSFSLLWLYLYVEATIRNMQ